MYSIVNTYVTITACNRLLSTNWSMIGSEAHSYSVDISFPAYSIVVMSVKE